MGRRGRGIKGQRSARGLDRRFPNGVKSPVGPPMGLPNASTIYRPNQWFWTVIGCFNVEGITWFPHWTESKERHWISAKYHDWHTGRRLASGVTLCADWPALNVHVGQSVTFVLLKPVCRHFFKFSFPFPSRFLKKKKRKLTVRPCFTLFVSHKKKKVKKSSEGCFFPLQDSYCLAALCTKPAFH